LAQISCACVPLPAPGGPKKITFILYPPLRQRFRRAIPIKRKLIIPQNPLPHKERRRCIV
jgi:hypothetical protein